MPEITEETLQAWAQLADYTDSHGSLDARVALDAAIAEIRRQREEISAKDGQIGALVESLNVAAEYMPPLDDEMRTHGVDCQCQFCEANRNREQVDALLADLPAAAQARDKRLEAEGAAEALEAAIDLKQYFVDVEEDPATGYSRPYPAVRTDKILDLYKKYKDAAERLREEAGR